MEDRLPLAYGDLAPDFGTNGLVGYQLSHDREFDDYSNAMAKGIAGTTWVGGYSEDRGTLAKLSPDGSLDTSFSNDGLQYLSFNNANNTSVTDLRPLADGSLLAVGQLTYSGSGQPYVAKFDATGQLDNSFGDQGVWLGTVSTRLTSFSGDSNDLVFFEYEGNVAGVTGTHGYRLIRLTHSGSLDSDFANSGKTAQIVARNAQSASVVGPIYHLHESDGLVFAYLQPGDDSTKVVRTHRFTLSGEIDEAFGDGGISVVDAGDAFFGDWIPFGGGDFWFLENSTNSFSISKFHYETGFDPEFGVLNFENAPDQYSWGNGGTAAELADGTFVVAWTRADRQSSSGFIHTAAITTDGLISDFGDKGRRQAAIPDRLSLADGIVMPSDRIQLFGSVRFPRDLAVVQLSTDGSLDSSFDQDGISDFDLTMDSSYIHGFEIHGRGAADYVATTKPGRAGADYPGQFWKSHLRDGTTNSSQIPYTFFSYTTPRSYQLASKWTLVAQHGRTGGSYEIRIDHISPDGELDPTKRISVPAPYHIDDFTFIPLEDGSVLLLADAYGAQASNSGLGFAILTKLSESGQLDTEFADQGVKRFPELPNRLVDIIQVPDGFRAILSNPYASNFVDKMFVMALDEHADRIASIADDGIQEILADVPQKRYVDGTTADGSLLLLLNAQPVYHFAKVSFYNEVDPEFGDAGLKSTLLSDATQRQPVHITWNQDDLIVGATVAGEDGFIELIAVTQKADPVQSFGTSGKATVNPGPSGDAVTSIVPLIDGTFLLSAESQTEIGAKGVVMRVLGPEPGPVPWHNILDPLNVTAHRGDTVVAPNDVLAIVNYLNNPTGEPRGYVDTNGDGFASPIDALIVVNFLNRQHSGNSGEGEMEPVQNTRAIWASINSWLFDDDRRRERLV